MSDHPEHNMHPNSLMAFRAELTNLRSRRAKVLAAYRWAGRPLTDRDVMRLLGFGGDPNKVRPRITELIKAGILKEVDNKTDSETRIPVRLVTLAPVVAEAA